MQGLSVLSLPQPQPGGLFWPWSLCFRNALAQEHRSQKCSASVSSFLKWEVDSGGKLTVDLP
jgi:hypothetical protein